LLTACCFSGELFIDDIHGITRSNAQRGGGVMDASVLLKPLLAR
jgi:ATP-dependent Clp protease ATP-binding subunit ClpA